MKQKPSHQPHTFEKRKLALPIFIAFILIFSVFGIIFGNPPTATPPTDTREDGPATFTRTPNGLWTTTFNNRAITLTYTPRDLTSINIPPAALTALRTAAKVYLTRDPAHTYGNAEYDLFTFRPALNVFLACTTLEQCGDLPIRTCADAADTTFIILLELDETSSTAYQSSCLTIRGDAITITKNIDRIILALSGVLP